MRKALLNIALILAGSVFGLLLSEVAARVFLDAPAGYLLYSRERASAHHTLETMVQDSRLLFRVPANAPGHDERGFRNSRSLSRADVVAIGDSQTWGINARQSEPGLPPSGLWSRARCIRWRWAGGGLSSTRCWRKTRSN